MGQSLGETGLELPKSSPSVVTQEVLNCPAANRDNPRNMLGSSLETQGPGSVLGAGQGGSLRPGCGKLQTPRRKAGVQHQPHCLG